MFNSTITLKATFCVLLVSAFCSVSNAQSRGQMTISYWDTLTQAEQQRVHTDLQNLYSYHDRASAWYSHHYNNYAQSGSNSEYQSMQRAAQDIERFAKDYNQIQQVINTRLEVTLIEDSYNQYPGVPRLRWNENVHQFLARNRGLFGNTSRITIAFSAGSSSGSAGGTTRGGGAGGNRGGSTSGGRVGTGSINWDDLNINSGASDNGSIMGQ